MIKTQKDYNPFFGLFPFFWTVRTNWVAGLNKQSFFIFSCVIEETDLKILSNSF
jgi:hypothetical protein